MPRKEYADPSEKPLTIREELFVDAMCSEETYLNKTRSYLKASPHVKLDSARNAGAQVAKRPHVRKRIKEVLEERGFGEVDRSNLLSEIGRGVATRYEERVTKSGDVVQVKVVPTFQDQLKAIQEANKMDGTYVQQKIEGDLAKEELKAIQERLRKEALKDVTPQKKTKKDSEASPPSPLPEDGEDEQGDNPEE